MRIVGLNFSPNVQIVTNLYLILPCHCYIFLQTLFTSTGTLLCSKQCWNNELCTISNSENSSIKKHIFYLGLHVPDENLQVKGDLEVLKGISRALDKYYGNFNGSIGILRGLGGFQGILMDFKGFYWKLRDLMRF